MTEPSVDKRLEERAAEHQRLLEDLRSGDSREIIELAARRIADSLEQGGKAIFFGNGGSAADAEHLSAEFVGRFRADRRPLASIALASNSAVVTALGNDYGFAETVFARELEALGKPEDTAIALTTSGRSPNVKIALEKARQLGIPTVAIVGGAHELDGCVDHLIVIDSTVTALIQEVQATVGHIICELVEDMMGFVQ